MTSTRRGLYHLAGLVLTALLIVLAARPAAAQAPATEVFDEQTRVIVTGGAVIPPGDTVDALVVLDGPAVVQGTVDGTVTATNGPVRVTGRVNGDVFAPNGRVTVTEDGFVDGDVTARSASVASGTVSGDVRQGRMGTTFSLVPSFAFWLAVSVSMLVLGLILVLGAPRAAAAVAAAGRRRVLPAVVAGVLVFLALIVLTVLAFVSLVGIPLGFLLLGGMFLIFALGYAATMLVVGHLILRSASPLVAFLVGLVVLRLLALIPAVGGLITFLAALYGLGVLLVSTRGAQHERAATPSRPAATARG